LTSTRRAGEQGYADDAEQETERIEAGRVTPYAPSYSEGMFFDVYCAPETARAIAEQ
jgi:hypothetical protein